MFGNVDWILIGLLGALGLALFNVSQKVVLDDGNDSITVAFHAQLSGKQSSLAFVVYSSDIEVSASFTE